MFRWFLPEDIMRPLRVAAIIDEIRAPAPRFRFHQLVPSLAELRITMECWATPRFEWRDPVWKPGRFASIAGRAAATAALKVPGIVAARSADATIVSRQLVQGFPLLERAIPGTWILDVDDALWEARPWGRRAAIDAAKRASAVVVANATIAEWYAPHNRRVVQIPTTVDTLRFTPRTSPPPRCFTIGWMGSRSNLPFLEGIAPALAGFLRANSSSRLLVVSDARPSLTTLPCGQVDFEYWSPDTEVGQIQKMSVGLMPLDDSPVARAKAAAKLLTYASTAIPVIASPVGVNAEILASTKIGWAARTQEQWLSALMQCADDQAAAATMGNNGRQMVETQFSAKVAAGKWATLLRELIHD